MTSKTNFSFELSYPERSAITTEERNDVMRKLAPTLQQAFAVKDSTVAVMVSDSHKGPNNKIVELTTTLQDADIEAILKQFCDTHGMQVAAVE